MITVTTTYVRPTAETQLYLDAFPAVASTFNQVRTSSASAPIYSVSTSPDGLTISSIAEFADQTQLDAFLNDLEAALPTFFNDRNAYCAAHNITIERVIT